MARAGRRAAQDLENAHITALASTGTSLLAGAVGGAYRSTDAGARWVPADTPIIGTIKAFAVIGSTVYVATYGSGVYRSIDDGVSWTLFNTGLTNMTVWALAVSGTTLFAGTTFGVFRSTGGAWSPVQGGPSAVDVASLATTNAHLFAGVGFDGVWRHSLN